MPLILQIALGGAIGACLRYGGARAVAWSLGGGFPWGTLAVNVTGSFLMGFAAVALALRAAPGLAPFVMTGVLGGFTTFSAFSLETFQLLQRGQTAAAAAYVGGSVALGLAGLVAGMALARSWAL